MRLRNLKPLEVFLMLFSTLFVGLLMIGGVFITMCAGGGNV